MFVWNLLQHLKIPKGHHVQRRSISRGYKHIVRLFNQNQMISFLELKNKILSIQYNSLQIEFEEFITPATDIHMLILLSFASREGLDIDSVDKEKFLKANSNDLIIEYLNEFAPEGNQFLNIPLDLILKDGKSFTYRDFYDVFGPNFMINSQLLIYDLELEIGDTLNVDFEYTDIFDINIRTLEELQYHLNNNQKERKIVSKNPWWKFWT